MHRFLACSRSPKSPITACTSLIVRRSLFRVGAIVTKSSINLHVKYSIGSASKYFAAAAPSASLRYTPAFQKTGFAQLGIKQMCAQSVRRLAFVKNRLGVDDPILLNMFPIVRRSHREELYVESRPGRPGKRSQTGCARKAKS